MIEPEADRPPARIDVLLPVRQPAPWLDEALTGLSQQSIDDWHLVCVVHGEAGDIPNRTRARFPSVTIVTMPSYATFVDVLNEGIGHCTAEYVARLDADDIPSPDRLAIQALYLDEHPDVTVVCSPVVRIDEDGAILEQPQPDRSAQELITGLRWKNVIAHPTVMIRRAEAVDCGGYNRDATHAEDYELWLRLAASGRIDSLPLPLLHYRLHPGQVTSTKAIPRSGRKAVGAARVALARARGESVVAARLRQLVWTLPQLMRSLQRRAR